MHIYYSCFYQMVNFWVGPTSIWARFRDTTCTKGALIWSGLNFQYAVQGSGLNACSVCVSTQAIHPLTYGWELRKTTIDHIPMFVSSRRVMAPEHRSNLVSSFLIKSTMFLNFSKKKKISNIIKYDLMAGFKEGFTTSSNFFRSPSRRIYLGNPWDSLL